MLICHLLAICECASQAFLKILVPLSDFIKKANHDKLKQNEIHPQGNVPSEVNV